MTQIAREPVSSGRLIQPASPQSNCVADDVVLRDEPAAHAVSWIGMDLKRCMFSVMATSVGSRSMLDAPKKPTTPVVRAMTCAASSGSAIGPPWQRHEDVGVDRPGGVVQRLDALDRLVERDARARADRAACRQAHVRDEHVRAGLGHRARLVRGEDVGRGQQVELARLADHLDLEAVAHAGLLQPGAERAVDEPDGREVLHAGEARARLTSSRKRGIRRNGSVPQTPASTGVVAHDRQHLAGHVHDDRVGVAVGHHPGERPAARPSGSGPSCR